MSYFHSTNIQQKIHISKYFMYFFKKILLFVFLLYINKNNMIYVIKLAKTNFIKVGYTSNLSSRLTSYKNAIPNEIIEFFIVKDGTRDDENYYRDKYRAYKTKSNSEWLELPDELIVELLNDFKTAHNVTINKQSKKEWYNDNIDKLVELCLSGVSLSRAAISLNALNWNWITYANQRYEKENGKKLTKLWTRKSAKNFVD